MNEQFSAFLDGEATRDETDSVIGALLRDDTLRASWTRQHWLRTTLRAHRGEVVVPVDENFSTRVMAAIAADEQPETVAPARVARLAQRRGSRRRRWRNMAGLAAVASATGFVLLVSNPLQRDEEMTRVARGTDEAVSSVAAADPAATGTAGSQMVASSQLSGDMLDQAQAVSNTTVRQGPADHWSVSDPALEDELNGYLVEHNGLARGYGLSGTTPAFVRVATYGQEPTQ